MLFWVRQGDSMIDLRITTLSKEIINLKIMKKLLRCWTSWCDDRRCWRGGGKMILMLRCSSAHDLMRRLGRNNVRLENTEKSKHTAINGIMTMWEVHIFDTVVRKCYYSVYILESPFEWLWIRGRFLLLEILSIFFFLYEIKVSGSVSVLTYTIPQ